MSRAGGRFDFEDGGTYSGGWLEGKAHGYGVCTGPKGQGEYAGAWVRGFEESGVYTWPSGNTYSGEWQDGKRHGVGVEIKGHWVYRGEWSHGYKGRYGIRQSTVSCAKYEGTWTTNLQDGYGIETYIDEGTYQGQWQKGMRHGFGVRQSAPYGIAAQYRDKDHLHSSMPNAINANQIPTDPSQRGRTPDTGPEITDRHRGGFVLTARSSPGPGSGEGEQNRSRSSSLGRSLADRFRLRRGQSTGDLPQTIRQQRTTSLTRGGEGRALGGSGDTGHGILSANVDVTDPEVREVYLGEWKADKRSGFGVSERSDGLKYVGEWYNDKKHGYGVTTLKDGTKEEGKYKDNELITSGRKRKLFTMSKTRLRDRVDAAVVSATRAAEVAQQKALIAVTRKTNARQKAESSDKAAMKALVDADLAREEAIKYNQDVPEKTSPREVPVNPETRTRIPPSQEDRNIANRIPDNVRSDLRNNSTRLLPPRQESSDSYNSNQSSSLGSSSVPTSPPPPKPPRSPPAAAAEGDPSSPPSARGPSAYPPRGRDGSDSVPPGPVEPQVVRRTNTPSYASGPKGLAPLNRSSSTGGGDARRAGHGEGQDLRSSAPGNRSDFDDPGLQSRNRMVRQDSFRNFRSSNRIETGSVSSYRDFSDSAESGNPPPVPGNLSGDDAAPTSPKILLRPATPTNLPGPRDVGNAPSQATHGYQSQVDPGRSHPQSASVDSGRPFSPVLSDRRYQGPEADGYIPRGVFNDLRPVAGDRESALSHHHRMSTNRRSFTPDFPVQLPSQPPYHPNATIPGQNFPTPRYSSASQTQLHDQSIGRNRSKFDGPPRRPTGSSPLVYQSLRRRETLPSIVRYPEQTPSPAGISRTQVRSRDGQPYRPSAAAKETFIVENGVRRRLIVEPPEPVYDRWQTEVEERQPVVCLQRFTLESAPAAEAAVMGLSKHGVVKSSLPDVHRALETTATIPREQVFALSQQRREELRREREEEKRKTLIIRLADVTAWCRDNQLILVLVALNLSLAAIFLNFLNHGSGVSKN